MECSIFDLFTMPQFTQLYHGQLQHGRIFPEKSTLCRNGQVCQGVKLETSSIAINVNQSIDQSIDQYLGMLLSLGLYTSRHTTLCTCKVPLHAYHLTAMVTALQSIQYLLADKMIEIGELAQVHVHVPGAVHLMRAIFKIHSSQSRDTVDWFATEC